MNIQYRANTLPGRLQLPMRYVENCRAEELAELAAADHWRAHPEDRPAFITVVHLHDVGGNDLGLFEVRYVQTPVFTACQLKQG